MGRRACTVALVFALLWVGAVVRAEAAPADDWAARVVALEQTRAARAADKARRDAVYERQTQEIAALKRRRASWRRDRELKALSAENQTTAAALQKLDAELRGIDAELRRTRRALLHAIDAELGSASPARQRYLLALRSRTRAVVSPQPNKIVLPDDSIDPLADAEELADQAALMKQAEAALAREEQALARREDRYRHMAKLLEKRGRAEELALLDDDEPRRATGRPAAAADRGNGASSPAPAGDGAPSSPPSGGPSPDGQDDGSGGSGGSRGEDFDSPGLDFDSGTSDPTLVLADVIELGTLDALRRAERSNDPAAKAAAAARARDEVKRRRERLEKQRVRVHQRIRALRGEK